MNTRIECARRALHNFNADKSGEFFAILDAAVT
jgi:hypothetical protein